MTRQQLEYFLSAAEFCNMSKAAAYHYVSVPTFARSINDLEDEFNTRLFERNNRGLIITRDGVLFHRFAWNTLSRMYDFQNNVSFANLMKQNVEAPFFIGYYPFGGMYVELAKLVDRFFLVWLKKQCSLRCVESGKMMQAVRTRHLQVGTISEITLINSDDAELYESRTLLRSDFQLLVGKGHPLAPLEEIDSHALLKQYGQYEDYLPFHSFDNALYREQKVENIHTLAWASVSCMPVWQASFDSENISSELYNSIFLLPGLFKRPEFNELHKVKLKNAPPHNIKLFWLRDNDSEDIQNFKAALDFAGITS